jgi:hypothetical protein
MSVTAIRRKYLLRLLAQLDQQIAETESLSRDPRLTDGEHRLIASQLDYRRNAVLRVEAMLANIAQR